MNKLLTTLIAAIFAGTTFTAVAQAPATPAPAAPGETKGRIKPETPKASADTKADTTKKSTKKKTKKKSTKPAEKM